DGADLRRFVEQATWVAVNDYEWQLLRERTGWDVADFTARTEALVITRGAQGSGIHTRDGKIDIPCAKAARVVDPTGCGDAYRAGLLHGLMHGLDWGTTGRIASLLGAIKIEQKGSQNHRFTREEFASRYKATFGTDLELHAA